MEKGRVYHSSLFLLRVVTKDEGKARFAAVAPVKIAKKATERNRIKRLIYEAISSLYKSLNQPVWVVVIAKVPALTAGLPIFSQEMKEIFVKARLLK